MAKDPAFLFYPGDYIGGTMHLDFECKGAYMDLLMLQFQKDHMTIHMIKQVLGHKFDHVWSLISDKFLEKDGNYWNERLRVEKEKRAKFCKSRKKNRESTKKVTTHMSSHMENEDLICIIVSYYETSKLLNGESTEEKNEIGMVVLGMLTVWKKARPGYSHIQEVDYPALLKLAYIIAERKGWQKHSVTNFRERDVVESWQKIVLFLNDEKTDSFLKRLTLDGLAIPKNFQKVEEAMKGSDFYKKERVKEMEKDRIDPDKYFIE